MRVSRAWGAKPDQVREWEQSDYSAALDDLVETPLVDAIVAAMFCPRKPSGASGEWKSFDLSTAGGQQALRAEMETWE
jgi:hypothetical protein